MKKYIVGVVGTQNTGKSTFIKDIMEESKKYNHPFQTTEIDYRKKIESEGLQINRNGNLRSQQIIFDCLVEQVKAAYVDAFVRNFITDRSPIDAYCYTVYLKRHNPDLGIRDEDLNEMYHNVNEYVKLYNEIIYIDLDNCSNVKLEDDKFRDTNVEYRKEIDQIFKEVLADLEKNGLKIDRSIFGTREERIKKYFVNRKEIFN